MASDSPPAVRTDDRVHDIIAVTTFGITVSTIAVILRVWSRVTSGKLSLWWDDWLIILTTVFSHAFQALGLAWIKFGLGKHIEAVPFSSILPGNYMAHAATALYAVCIYMIKISALAFYARIFKQSPTFRKVLWLVGCLATAWFICTFTVPWFNCTPVRKTLDPFGPGVCFDRMRWYLGSAFINPAFDLLTLLLPMPVIWRLQMTRRKKISVTIVFVLGYWYVCWSLPLIVFAVYLPSLSPPVY